MLPNKKTIKVKIDHNTDSFLITDFDGNKLPEFENTSNIILHDVTYNEVGVFYGNYLKPKHLQYYEEKVDKTVFPRYIDWCLDSKDSGNILEKVNFEDPEYEEKYKALDEEKETIRISEDGKFKNGFDEYVKFYKRIFLTSRIAFNDKKSITTMTVF